MEYRRLGKTELKPSVVGFGCWAMGGRSWGPVDDGASMGAVRRALELGVTLFDTAPAYGLGHSEELLGRALGANRRDVLIATKCGLKWDSSEKLVHDNSARRIREEIDLSLRRLGTDWVDLYQVHWPDSLTPLEETMRALEEVRSSGKARHVGCSNFSIEQIEEASRHGLLETLQPPLSLLDRASENDLLPYCEKHDLGVLVYGPLARGLLTGKFSARSAFGADDLRHRDERFLGEALARNVALVARLRSIAARHGRTPAELAIAWVLSRPAVSIALCGARSAQQIEESAGAASWQLGAEEQSEIDALLQDHRSR